MWLDTFNQHFSKPSIIFLWSVDFNTLICIFFQSVFSYRYEKLFRWAISNLKFIGRRQKKLFFTASPISLATNLRHLSFWEKRPVHTFRDFFWFEMMTIPNRYYKHNLASITLWLWIGAIGLTTIHHPFIIICHIF